MRKKFNLTKQGYQESFAKSLWSPIANRDWLYAPILADMVSPSNSNAIIEVEVIKEIIRDDADTLIVIITRVGGREHRTHGGYKSTRKPRPDRLGVRE